ncbi:hypothetical protein ACFL0M_08085 [Thermodesulfobacteriota bacterium]
MYGWRGRIGHVSPALHDTQALEERQFMPEGVMVVTTCLGVQNLVNEEFARAFSIMEQGALALAREEVGAIIVGGGPIFCMKGLGSHQKIIDSVFEKTGIPTSTTLSAPMDALKSLGVKRIAIATPYVVERIKALRKYLEGYGFEVLAEKGLGITRNLELTKVSFNASYQIGVDVFRQAKGIEAIYMPCSRWPIVGNIGHLERDLGIPVVSNIQATAWFGLKSLGIKERIKDYGILLEKLAD